MFVDLIFSNTENEEKKNEANDEENEDQESESQDTDAESTSQTKCKHLINANPDQIRKLLSKGSGFSCQVNYHIRTKLKEIRIAYRPEGIQRQRKKVPKMLNQRKERFKTRSQNLISNISRKQPKKYFGFVSVVLTSVAVAKPKPTLTLTPKRLLNIP